MSHLNIIVVIIIIATELVSIDQKNGSSTMMIIMRGVRTDVGN